MRRNITKSLVEKAKPQAKPYRIYDSIISGFSLRVQPTGRKIWMLEIKRKTKTLGHYPAMTVAMARERAKQIINGDVPIDQKIAPTLGKFIDQYFMEYASTRYANPKEAISHLVRTGFTEKQIDTIRMIDAEKYRTKRLNNGIAPSSINRQMATLKAALQKAVEWEIIKTNPLAQFKQLKLDAIPVVRYLTTGEEQRLSDALQASTPWLRTFVTTALNTGCRRAELWQLTWGDIDLKTKKLTIHGGMAKSGQTRHVPLNQTAIKTLTAWRGDATPLPNVPVFGRHEFKKSWKTLMQKTGIEDFTFHCCRHHFASKLVMAGVPLNTVRELLGHADLKMTLRYSHLAPDTMLEAVELIG